MQPSINLGLNEDKFWDMTVAEINRWIEGATWRLKSQAQFNHILADLIGVSVARVMSSEIEFPTIDKVYPELFADVVKEEKEKVEDDKQTQKSVNNFLARAMAINKARKAKEDEGVIEDDNRRIEN